MIKVGDKVAYDIVWTVQFGEVITIKKSLFGLEKQLLVRLENPPNDGGQFDMVPASQCMKLTDEEYERLKELSKKKGKK